VTISAGRGIHFNGKLETPGGIIGPDISINADRITAINSIITIEGLRTFENYGNITAEAMVIME
jgi:hypothetical protein